MGKLKVIISGGGTGGHIFPAISIANAISTRFPDSEILFVGANDRMEMQRVPEAGYNIIGLDVAGFNRKKILKNIKVLWKYLLSIRKAKKIIKEFRPHVAVGVGGYASGAMLQAAASQNIPILIQEQNSYAGVTNKHYAKSASVICVAYSDMEEFFPNKKIVLTGNPCRQGLMSDVTKEEAAKYFGLDPDKKTLLIVGGSLGSRTINRGVQHHISLLDQSDIQVIWQAGEYYFHEIFMEMENKPEIKNIKFFTFIERMDLAYKMANLVVSRAGAGTISELSLLGKPVILIPSPNVAEDHQTKNAMALVKQHAAVLVKDEEAEGKLIQIALQTISDNNKLVELSENISSLAQRDSANRIVDEMVDMLKEKLNDCSEKK